MVRYNLQTSGLLGPTGAFLWAVVAPWVFTAFFYQAQVGEPTLRQILAPPSLTSTFCSQGWSQCIAELQCIDSSIDSSIVHCSSANVLQLLGGRESQSFGPLQEGA